MNFQFSCILLLILAGDKVNWNLSDVTFCIDFKFGIRFQRQSKQHNDTHRGLYAPGYMSLSLVMGRVSSKRSFKDARPKVSSKMLVQRSLSIGACLKVSPKMFVQRCVSKGEFIYACSKARVKR